jgi:hypothetical protein
LNNIGDPIGKARNQILGSIDAKKILRKRNHMEYEVKFSEKEDGYLKVKLGDRVI